MDDLVQMGELAGRPLDAGLKRFNAIAAGRAWGWFTRTLGTATAPFFRIQMGDRYFSAEACASGAILWGLAILCQFVWLHFTANDYQEEYLRYGRIHKQSYTYLIAGVIMCASHLYLGWQSIEFMRKCRNDGTLYHSMSRGVARLGNLNYALGVGIIIFLFFTNKFMLIFFIAALVMNEKLEAEQMAAIYSRYIDAIDQKVEDEYLQDALLSKCPIELTYLSKPLPGNLNETVRSNIAAAAAGKPVTIVSKKPQPSSSTA